MKILRLAAGALLWPIAHVVDLLVAIAGLVVVPLLARRPEDETEMVPSLADGELVLAWRRRWALPWSNLDEGIDPLGPPTNPSGRRWWERSRGWSARRRIVSWSALRNPASGLRLTRFGAVIEPARVEWVGNSPDPGLDDRERPGPTYWCWARQGARSGLWITRRGRAVLRVGWTIHPAPRRPIDARAGVKLQVWRRR